MSMLVPVVMLAVWLLVRRIRKGVHWPACGPDFCNSP